MKEELMYQQLSQVLASVNDGAPELFRQIIISGYIYNITGIVLLFVASLVVKKEQHRIEYIYNEGLYTITNCIIK